MKTLNFENKTIHFVSTAHVSKASVEEVKDVIESVQPDAVCIELDSQRAYSLQHRDEQKDIDIKQVIKNKKVGSFITTLVLSSYQKRLADDLGTQVGQEMLQAIESANAIGARTHMIDRDIQITFQRIWRNISFWKKINLIATLFTSFFTDNSVENEDIEALKQSDLLYDALKDMDQHLPDVSLRLLHERNYYMAEKIKSVYGDTLVVVVGAAHTEGIIEALNQSYSLSELNTVPAKKKNSWIQWVIPAILLILVGTLTFRNPQVGFHQFLIWMALSAGLATLGAIIAGAHPFTILTTLVTAPIGTLSPFLAVGIFAGLMEAYQRPPTTKDFDTLSDDITKPKRWFQNKVLRILLVLLLTNLLSSIGTFIAGGNIIKTLFNF